MNLVKNIHNVRQKIHPNSKSLKHYKEKLFESFSFMEDENDNKPLEPKKQKELSSFLNLLIDFESDPDIDDEIEKIEITPLKNVNFLTCDQF